MREFPESEENIAYICPVNTYFLIGFSIRIIFSFQIVRTHIVYLSASGTDKAEIDKSPKILLHGIKNAAQLGFVLEFSHCIGVGNILNSTETLLQKKLKGMLGLVFQNTKLVDHFVFYGAFVLIIIYEKHNAQRNHSNQKHAQSHVPAQLAVAILRHLLRKGIYFF